ncbi:hypothetical protein RB595_001745 [Gaeumannomyces hyphopodioides]
MKIHGAAAGLIPRRVVLSPQPCQFASLAAPRTFATQPALASSSAPSSGPKRRAVTPFNDDGRVPWTQLSGAEKTARAAQQTLNLGLMAVGFVLTGGVAYFLYSEVFSPDSKVAFYNRAVDRIRKDPRCIELLGEGRSISAHGEETTNKWRRARPIASQTSLDPQGNEHLRVHFFVEGPKGQGTASMHMVRCRGQEDFEYKYFFVDVAGHERIYLEGGGSWGSSGPSKRGRLFGINWS